MKSTGVIRKLDGLGRITIPADLRRTLGIADEESFEIFIDEENRITLQPSHAYDIFTGRPGDCIEYCGKSVSRESIAELAKKAGLI